MSSSKVKLPIDQYIPEILKRFRETSNMILSATPGSGKTTRLPSRLLELTDKKVLVLEPRRIATVSAVDRIATEEGWTLGKEIGYQIRFDNKTSAETRLIFFTEALLLRWLQRDPELADVGLIVLDEFHERSVHTDTALALLKELQENFRPDLKILVMSATLQVEGLKAYLPEAATFEVEAPIHPLQIAKAEKTVMYRPGAGFKQQEDWYRALADTVMSAFQKSPGQKDVLVFLPGAREINELKGKLEAGFSLKKGDTTIILPLHAQLPLEEQRKALRPLAHQRKIILATNVAESALTIEGVDTVVDSGLERMSMIHRKTGHPSLELVRISKASATQRAGRAARLGPGLALQMWSRHDESAMSAERAAEIHRVDLSETHLFLAGQGVTQPQTLPWLENPGVEAWRRSSELLTQLGLIDDDGRLTALGREALPYPLSPRWSVLMIEAIRRGEARLGAEVAALLQNWPQDKRRVADFGTYFEDYRKNPNHFGFGNAKRSMDQLLRLSGSKKTAHTPPDDDDPIATLLWHAFPDRLCRLRTPANPSGQAQQAQTQFAQMRGGRGVKLSEPARGQAGFFLALELIEGFSDSESLCGLRYELSENFVKSELVPKGEVRREVEWVDKESAFISWEGLKLGELWLDQPRRSRPKPAEVEEGLAKVALKNWKEILQRNEALSLVVARLQFWYKLKTSEDFELTDEILKQVLPFLSMGRTSLEAFYREDLSDLFLQGIATALSDFKIANFNREVPAGMISPRRGKYMVIDYREAPAPKVQIRIQDAFGWKETPKIMGVPLLIELLAPNNRPAQRTQDLAGFWKNSYKDVRKDLRARYPRHAWPEDPMAPPEEEAD